MLNGCSYYFYIEGKPINVLLAKNKTTHTEVICIEAGVHKEIEDKNVPQTLLDLPRYYLNAHQ